MLMGNISRPLQASYCIVNIDPIECYNISFTCNCVLVFQLYTIVGISALVHHIYILLINQLHCIALYCIGIVARFLQEVCLCRYTGCQSGIRSIETYLIPSWSRALNICRFVYIDDTGYKLAHNMHKGGSNWLQVELSG